MVVGRKMLRGCQSWGEEVVVVVVVVRQMLMECRRKILLKRMVHHLGIFSVFLKAVGIQNERGV